MTDDGTQAAIARVYCTKCDQTLYYGVTGDDEGLFGDAAAGDLDAMADLEEIRYELLVAHRAVCAA